MKEIIVGKLDDGMRFDKYIHKIFKKMPTSTFHKLLRKKYFKINDIKADGREILSVGDRVAIFLSGETYDRFVGDKDERNIGGNSKHRSLSNDKSYKNNNVAEIKKRIVYEDKNVIIYDKEVGLLSQGDRSNDKSVNTILNEYLGTSKTKEAFKPSVVNRLDRNTRGLIIFAKTYIAAREISRMIKDGEIDKYYLATVNGRVKKDKELITHLLRKDTKTNKVEIREYKCKVLDGYSKVSLEYKVLSREKDVSTLEIRLITGKSHQIRAELSYIGHPLLGDKKYMVDSLYKMNVEKCGVKTQVLTCYKIRFGKFEDKELEKLSDKTFKLR